MMNKEILLVVETLSNKDDIPKEDIFVAIEEALAMATRKRHGTEWDVRVSIDRSTGDYKAFRRWQVLADDTRLLSELSEEELEALETSEIQYFESEERHIFLRDALKRDEALQAGDFIEESVPPSPFGRIEAQAAKHVIMDRIRRATRAKVVKEYSDKVGSLVSGVVKRVTRDALILDLGGDVEALLRRELMIPRENFRMGDRLRAYLEEVRSLPKGPQLFLNRICPELLVELFTIEVPEIGEGLIEIKRASRDPGSRAKIAVKTNDGRIDPVGACVGMRGSRVQAVSSELSGERIDIVLWDADPVQFVINAMSPAEVASIVVDEETASIDVAVKEDQLSQAIGRNGQNVRLASDLSGWKLVVMNEAEAQEKTEAEAQRLLETFMHDLNLEEDVALVLVEEGFSTLEEVAYVPEEEMLAIDGFDQAVVDALRARAKDVLLTRAIADEEKLSGQEPAADLLEMEGMDRTTAYKLASLGVVTREDLAEQAVVDLEEVDDLSQERAAELIMTARKIWFTEEQA